MENQKYSYVGKSLKRVDAADKISGRTRYATDIKMDGMLYAYPVFSTIASGSIRKIDTKLVAESDGFVDFFRAEDVPGENQVGVIFPDQELLASKKVRYIGDSIGIIVAESQESAENLSRLVDIEYEEKKPILSIEESQSSTDDFIHKSNVACHHMVERGKPEEAFEKADYIVEASFKTPYQEHCYLEPQACIAVPECNGSICIYGSIQCVFYVQKAVAKVLGLPYSKVRVVQTPTGGAFGGKEDIPSEVCSRAALAAWKLNRPVKTVYSYRDDIQVTSKRHPVEFFYKVGVSKDGKLLAAEVELNENAGAYATLSSVVSYRASVHALGPYVVPNVSVKSTAWYTNLPPTGAFRGFGSPQATFGHERMMDTVASAIGMDPIEFRLKNVLLPGSETITGHKLLSSVGVKETIEKVRDASRWNDRNEEKEKGRFLKGIGISASHYGNCLGAAGWIMDGASAKIQVRRDGSIAVAFGLIEMGQGALTVVTQMAADAIGVKAERITVLPTDTQNVSDSGPSVASRNVVMTGNAILSAAKVLKPFILEAASQMLECEKEEIEIKDDLVRIKNSEDFFKFEEVTEYMYIKNIQMDSLGWWHVPELDFKPEIGNGEAYFTYSYSTHLAEVKIDKISGLVHVEKIWAAHDIGKAINPSGIEGQVEGGVVQGVGWALTEDFKISDGKVETDNFSTYLLPTAMDIPEVETIIVEDSEPLGPWGAKGIGEPAIIPTAAAIANAVSDALGTQIEEIPIRPEKVLQILSEKNR